MRAQAHRSTPPAQFLSKTQRETESEDATGSPTSDVSQAHYGEGPLLMRVLLVLSSMSPLFLLWAIRGTKVMPDWRFWLICALLFVAPNVYLLLRVRRARAHRVLRTIVVGKADDRRQDLISYLFAMLLPFYAVNLSTGREFAATIVAFLIVVVLFTSLNLHYMNFLIAVFGYHCFQVRTPASEASHSEASSFMVVTKKAHLRTGSRLTGYLVSSTLLIEKLE